MNHRYLLALVIIVIVTLSYANVTKIPVLNKKAMIIDAKLKSLSGESRMDISRAIAKHVPKKHWNDVIAICWIESRFNHKVISPTGDYGLMGINRKTWQKSYDGRFAELLTVEKNIIFGYQIYKMYRNSSSSRTQAFLRYNGGNHHYPVMIAMVLKKIE